MRNPHAFPQLKLHYDSNGWTVDEHQPQPGMSLRDYFAGQALIGFLADCQNVATLEKMQKESGKRGSEITAIMCYEIADAMLHQREKVKA